MTCSPRSRRRRCRRFLLGREGVGGRGREGEEGGRERERESERGFLTDIFQNRVK